MQLTNVYFFGHMKYDCSAVNAAQYNCLLQGSLLYKSKGKDHLLSTSQKVGLAGLYKKFLFLSSTAISKPVLQEVDGTVIPPLTFIKE